VARKRQKNKIRRLTNQKERKEVPDLVVGRTRILEKKAGRVPKEWAGIAKSPHWGGRNPERKKRSREIAV